MRDSTVATLIVFLLSPFVSSAQTPTVENGRLVTEPDQAVVHLGLFGYGANGAANVAAFDKLTPTKDSIVYAQTGACGLGAGRLTESAPDAWRFRGEVLSNTPTEAVVRLEWQRVRAGGVEVTVPRDSTQITIRAGERVVLDSVAGGSPTCNNTHAALELRYEPQGLVPRPQRD